MNFHLRLATFVMLCLPMVAGAEVNPAAIVQRADEIRFPTKPFQVLVDVTTQAPSRAPAKYRYQVLQKGHENSVVRTLAPESEAGQVMLLRGADLWVFMPAVSQPVRLPLAQRLTGQVANGDLARANFADDYHAKFVRTEQIDGKDCYVLDLTAARKGVTYQRVAYWVEVASGRPRKVEFYTLSGRLMKTGLFEEFRDLGGAVRPTRLVLHDGLRKGESSVLQYSALKLRDIPDKFFTKDFLRKLQN